MSSIQQRAGAPKVAFDLDDLTDQLEMIADWKDDLRRRIWRAQMIFELADFDHDFGPLQQEVEDFKRVCRSIRWRAA
jgi:hypothetical protein